MARPATSLLLLSLLLGCSEAAPPTLAPAPSCPEGQRAEPARAARIRAQLGSTAAGAQLLAERDGDAICFSDIQVSSVTEGRVFLLAEDDTDDALAARLGHLLHHAVNGMPFPDEVPGGADCEAIVERAVEREAEAYVLEIRLRAELGLVPDRFDFEPAVLGTTEPDDRLLVAEYLRAHPDGARNLDPLVSGYLRRCRAER